MTGAIIGDLAAWTWKNDPDAFYPQLVSPHAEQSTWGQVLMTTGSLLFKDRHISKETYERSFHLECSKCELAAVIRAIPIAWLYDTEKEVEQATRHYCLIVDKEDLYASHFMAKLIFALRKGATKKEAAMVEFLSTFRSFTKSIHVQQAIGPLSILVRAWMAFYDSFDYTSAIHNAMKLPGDQHVNAILVGALAEAMYGCRYLILKKKFCPEDVTYRYIELPKNIYKGIEEWCNYQRKIRSFFPKNDAFTNVEYHFWISCPVPTHYQKLTINKELARRITKAFETGWEARFGFYLDNGKIYVYRSGFLLCRFELKNGEPIKNFEIAADFKDKQMAIEGFKCAMDTVENHWYKESDEERPSYLRQCKYYRGETQCPDHLKNTVAAKFWHGEMMFIVHKADMNHWKQMAIRTKEGLNEDQLQLVSQYSEEQFAIILYIEELYSKWCPYDDMKWIYQY